MATSKKDMTEREWALLGNIGGLFKDLRTEAGFSQKEAARRIGTSQARLPVLENGQADVMITTLQRWAKVYGYELEISVIKLPDKGEVRINDDGTIDEYDGDFWVEVEPISVQTLTKEDAA